MKDVRNIYSNLEYKQLGENFTKKFLFQKNEKNLELITQNKKPEFGGEWSSKLKPKLVSLLENRCPICERKISHSDSNANVIEHYRPKAHYWWLAYDYENYTLACSTCNLSKSDKFPLYENQINVEYSNRSEITNEKPLLINPFLEEPYKYFQLMFSNYSGSRKYNVIKLLVSPLLKDDYEIKKAQKTIEIFNLNLHKVEERYRGEQIADFEDFCEKLLPFALELKQKADLLRKAFILRNKEPEKFTPTFYKAEKEYKEYIEKMKCLQNSEIAKTGYWQLLLLKQFEIQVIR